MSATQLPAPGAPGTTESPPRLTVKQLMQRLVDRLPEGATWDDVLDRIDLFRVIERGVASADAGDLVPQEEVERLFGVRR